MALTRLSNPVDDVTPLTSALWIAEFDNIYNNPLSLISPLAGDLDFNGNKVKAISAGSVSAPSIYPTGDTNTGLYFSAADTVDITAGGVRSAQFKTAASGVNYVMLTPAAATASPIIDVEGSDTNIGLQIDTKGTGSLFLKVGGSTKMEVNTNGAVLVGNAAATNVGNNCIVMANNTTIQYVNAAGTDTANFGMSGTSSDNMKFMVPATTNKHAFFFVTDDLLDIVSENAGAGIKFMSESSADHAAPSANQVVIYAKDNGGGKTQLVARFSSGAVQQIAIQP